MATTVKADIDPKLSGLIRTLAARYNVKVGVVAGAILSRGALDEAFLRSWRPDPSVPHRNENQRGRRHTRPRSDPFPLVAATEVSL